MKTAFLILFLAVAGLNLPTASAQSCEGKLLPLITQEAGNLTVTNEFDTYQWTRNGQDITGATARTFTPTEAGDYQVKVTKRSKAFSFTPTSIDEAQSSTPFRMYPNPTSENVTIVMDQMPAGNGTVSLMNLNGQTVLSQAFVPESGNAFKLNLQSLSKGTYGVKITVGNRTATRLLVVE